MLAPSCWSTIFSFMLLCLLAIIVLILSDLGDHGLIIVLLLSMQLRLPAVSLWPPFFLAEGSRRGLWLSFLLFFGIDMI